MLVKFKVEFLIESDRLNTIPRGIAMNEALENNINKMCHNLEKEGYRPSYKITDTRSLN